MRASRFLVLLVAGPAVIAIALLLYGSFANTSARRIAMAGEAIDEGDYSRALELTSHLLDEKDPSVDALQVGISAARLGGRPERMLDLCRRIPSSASGPEVLQTLKTCGQTALRTGQAADAEAFYLRALQLAPDDLLVHRRLSALYLAQARRWESHPHLLALIKGKAFTLDNIGFLGNMEELYDAERLIAHFEQSDPDNLVPLMGRARLLIFKGFSEKGEALLRQILQRHPDFIEAQAQLGVVLVSSHREAEFYEWHRQLPEGAQGHPEIWWVQGTQARREGNIAAAIRCAWEALRLDPNHLGATYQLAQLLATDGQEQKAQVFAERAGRLEELASAIHHILLREATPQHMLQCASICEEIGRVWEAWGWHVAVETYHPEDVVPGERERLAALLTSSTPQTLPEHQLALRFDLSSYPLPDWNASSGKSAPKSGDAEFPVRFADATEVVVLDFHYHNGVVDGKPGLMIHESIGGGVSVVDYDCDGRPDLFFPQARPGSPLAEMEEDASDQLFRNVDGNAVNVSSSALPTDHGYGFGANVGDINADGFPDLYVGNAGRNVLLLNNGDGTFSDVTDAAGIVDEQWTSSTLIADINGDGLPDLYDVNYCAGDEPFEKVCLRQNGGPRTCIPTEFAAADDRLLVNLGDGRFREVGETAGILEPEGRGLGVIAANLDDRPGIDLYVANDMTANFFFSNRTGTPGDLPVFREQGVTSGLAYDSDGRPQASMGIAVDDADGDGLIDLFLTHFYNESNTFYRQQAPGVYIDETNLVDLRQPGMQLLGFGTQFLDAELDGWPDLVITNGHVDDFTEKEIPYRMKPQFFHNNRGKFVEGKAEALGPFFAREQLGRGLARLDWDRDGLEDFVVARLIRPAALVQNQTPLKGHYLALRLTGRLDRDGIGTVVEVVTPDRTWTRQLVAGDGFECTNERRLVFGLGDAARVQQVRLRWPGGHEDVLENLPVNRDLHIVEGEPHVYLLPAGSER